MIAGNVWRHRAPILAGCNMVMLIGWNMYFTKMYVDSGIRKLKSKAIFGDAIIGVTKFIRMFAKEKWLHFPNLLNAIMIPTQVSSMASVSVL